MKKQYEWNQMGDDYYDAVYQIWFKLIQLQVFEDIILQIMNIY